MQECTKLSDLNNYVQDLQESELSCHNNNTHSSSLERTSANIMVQTLKSIHGGGGSIRVGTTGTIGALMTRELDSLKRMPHTSPSSREMPPTVPVSVPCGSITRKSLPRRNSTNETTTSSNNSSSRSYRNPRNTQKMKSNLQKNDHHIPMLSSRDVPTERKTNREKPDKKGPYIVEVVDLKCGNIDKTWSSPITTRLKKLGFSKLSETAV